MQYVIKEEFKALSNKVELLLNVFKTDPTNESCANYFEVKSELSSFFQGLEEYTELENSFDEDSYIEPKEVEKETYDNSYYKEDASIYGCDDMMMPNIR